MSKTIILVITTLLIILPLLIFPLKSTEISFGFMLGYRCSCLGIEMPTSNINSETNLCYGVPFSCSGDGYDINQLTNKIKLNLFFHILPVLIFLLYIFTIYNKLKIASNKKLISVIVIILLLMLIMYLAVPWLYNFWQTKNITTTPVSWDVASPTTKEEINRCYNNCFCPCECICSPTCKKTIENFKKLNKLDLYISSEERKRCGY
jgi:hypothetical protein